MSESARNNPFFLFISVLLLILAACSEPEEGCLDIEATNFNAAADKSCCCEYPELQIELLPRFDTLVWKPDTAYEYTPGKWFRLKQIIYYLSDFQLVQNGQAIRVSDTLTMNTWGAANDTAQTIFTNDFLLIRRSAVSYTPGTFRPSGTFESIRFRIGIPDSAQQVIPGLAPAGHPLQLQSEGLWRGRDTGFVALQLVLTRDTASTTLPDTLVFSRPDFTNLALEKTGVFQHESGYNFKLVLTADYKALFEGVDLSGGDILTWKSQIIANLTKAFRVSQ